jgi:hypothetical protein
MSSACIAEPVPCFQKEAAGVVTAAAVPNLDRFVLIDWIRGFLILLMASSHAIGLCLVGAGSFLVSAYWLPRGWATDGFITVSGLTAALVYDWERDRQRACRGLRRRALQLLVVMLVSNVALLITKYGVTGDLGRIARLDWWFGLFTLKTQYSISGVLLPTSVLLLLLPVADYLRQRWGLTPFALGALFVALVIRIASAEWSANTPVFRIISFGAGFPVIPFVATGMLGFAAGFWWKYSGQHLKIYPVLPLFVLVPVHWTSRLGLVLSPLLPLARIVLLIIVAIALMRLPGIRRCAGFVPLIGRYSLFCFLGHRVIMQTAIIIGRLLHAYEPQYLYAWSMLTTLCALVLLCLLRTRNQSFDSACRRFCL